MQKYKRDCIYKTRPERQDQWQFSESYVTAELERMLFYLRCGVHVGREMEGVRAGVIITLV